MLPLLNFCIKAIRSTCKESNQKNITNLLLPAITHNLLSKLKYYHMCMHCLTCYANIKRLQVKGNETFSIIKGEKI